jgi:glycosyltransferase involved in cell wall biosynthesis
LFLFPRAILKKINACDIYYSPYFNIPGGVRIPIYTTIHDIIFPDMPEMCSRIGLAARMVFYRRAAKKSKIIFTVSDFSKGRIECWLGKNLAKAQCPVIVTHSAIQPYLLEKNTAEPAISKTIIFIGNIKKHKGLSILLDAFLAAREKLSDYTLVIVGEKDAFRSTDNDVLAKIDALEDSAVRFTGRVSDAELKKLLSSAALLVQPSLYEGFCLPPLEAMVCGTPALVSDIPVIREIYEGCPVNYFKAGSAEDLEEKLLQLLYKKQPERIKLNDALKYKYTFKKAAEIILGAL